jgi:hypothetical protein
MLRKVIKDIVYCTVEDLKNGLVDNGFMIDGKDLLECDTIEDGLEILKQNGLIKDDCAIIPKGFILNEVNIFGGAVEYVFNQGKVQIDLALDNKDEYLSEDISELMKHNTENLLTAAIANMILENYPDDADDIDEALIIANEMCTNAALYNLDIIVKNYLEDR